MWGKWVFVVLIAAFLGAIGLGVYDRYFVTTNLVVCVDDDAGVELISIQSTGAILDVKPVNGVARFENIAKGYWEIIFWYQDGPGVGKGAGFFNGIETKLYCPET
ncbi:MAG: hypothetical protein HYW90_02875 [Candidatus Sungbacteria bacterium]|nr:hypothetical protein [Candidatus Sungbacteria bacterium]